jgi:hypothetical protein
MTRWPTYRDLARGPVGIGEVSRAFQTTLVDRLLGVVWETYDALFEREYQRVSDWGTDLRDLERSLTQGFERELSDRVRHLNGGHVPVRVQHGTFEHMTQRSNVGQPPAYDIAFVWVNDDRIIWPLEAKVFRDDRDTDSGPGEYVENGVRRYLDRTYAPFVLSGAMLGYLRSGTPKIVMSHVQRRLGVPLQPYTSLDSRDHWVSDHMRPATENAGQEAFRCHHLVLKLGS